MIPHVLEHPDIKSHGLELTVQKQDALLLKEFVNYKLFMTKTAERLHVPIPYKGVPPAPSYK